MPQCCLVMEGNDIPPISPPDAIQTCTKINMPSEFIPEDIYNQRKQDGILTNGTYVQDQTIKSFVSEYEVSLAFLLFIISRYQSHKPINCPVVNETTQDFRIDCGDETSFIQTTFKFTGKAEDIITIDQLKSVHTLFKAKGIKLSISKLKSLIIVNGASYDKHLGEKKTIRGYRGIVLLTPLSEEEEKE